MKTRLLLVFVLVASVAHPFIPPLTELLNDVFAGRKNNEAVELQFRHQVQVKEGEFIEVTEQFLGNRSGGLIQWAMNGQPPVYCDWNGKDYTFRNGKTVPSRTAAFIDYFLVEGGTEYQDRLLRERFLRRDQLLQYRPGYNPAGDPKTWDVKANYLLHDDIFLVKLPREFAVSVVGMSEGDQKRAFYLSRTGRGISRLEWVVGSETAAWDFGAFAATPGMGRMPRVLSLQINGMERVKSTLSSAKPIRRDALATARTASRQPSSSASPSSQIEEAIRLIVRYR